MLFLCLTASNKIMPVATEALRLSILFVMGNEPIKSHSFRTRDRIPLSSPPITIAIAPFKSKS